MVYRNSACCPHAFIRERQMFLRSNKRRPARETPPPPYFPPFTVVPPSSCCRLFDACEHMFTRSRRIGLTDQNVVPVSALANRYEVLPLMAQCEGYMKVTP